MGTSAGYVSVRAHDQPTAPRSKPYCSDRQRLPPAAAPPPLRLSASAPKSRCPSPPPLAQEELLVVWALLIVTVVSAYIIKRQRFKWLPPSSCAMLLGIVAGIASRLVGLEKPLRFSPGAFFYALLPPIVFQAVRRSCMLRHQQAAGVRPACTLAASPSPCRVPMLQLYCPTPLPPPPPPPPQGLELRKKAFFANIGAILTFAVLGTFVSALAFGLATYALVLLGIVRRAHLAGSPLVECLL